MLSSFPIALPSFLCGVIGSIITNTFKPFPLPYFIINQLVSVITKLTSEKPPRLLSGATLDVQRQQHMDLLEAFVLNMQQRQVSYVSICVSICPFTQFITHPFVCLYVYLQLFV